MSSLPRYTWDQAEILRFASASSFRALGIHPGTVRRWASKGHIQAVGKGPKGAHLYLIADVTGHAERRRSHPG